MSDFWNRKLGVQTQPRGIVVQPYAQTPHIPQPMVPQSQVPVPQQYMSPQEQAIAQANAAHAAQANDPNRQMSLREAVSRWKGGEAWRTEGHLSCPGCGSQTGYTQYSGMGGMAAGVMGNKPRGHCFECGYNGSFQQGDQANWS